jgi:hypothetical protein
MELDKIYIRTGLEYDMNRPKRIFREALEHGDIEISEARTHRQPNTELTPEPHRRYRKQPRRCLTPILQVQLARRR